MFIIVDFIQILGGFKGFDWFLKWVYRKEQVHFVVKTCKKMLYRVDVMNSVNTTVAFDFL